MTFDGATLGERIVQAAQLAAKMHLALVADQQAAAADHGSAATAEIDAPTEKEAA
jgi:hypothetical protein